MAKKIIPVPLETKEEIVEVDALVPARLVENRSVAPTTTLQEDLVVEAQRGTSLMWETTQKIIALVIVIGGYLISSLVVIVVLYIMISKLLEDKEISTLEYSLLIVSLGGISQTSSIIIGFYFGRTNHTKIGGVGIKSGDGR